MGKELAPIPDWARQEREGDLAWVAQNLHMFWLVAMTSVEEYGRGAVVFDTTLIVDELGHPILYIGEELVAEELDEDTLRMVRHYRPEEELVVTLLKPAGRLSSYRVQFLPGEVKIGDTK